MYLPHTNKSLHDSLLDSSTSIRGKSRIEMMFSNNPNNRSKVSYRPPDDISFVNNPNRSKIIGYRPAEDVSLLRENSHKSNENKDHSLRNRLKNMTTRPLAKISQNSDKSRSKNKDLSMVSQNFERSRTLRGKDSSQNFERSRNKANINKDQSSNSSMMFSFDNNLKQQMEHFKYTNLNEILEEDAFMGNSPNIYAEELIDKCPEVPLFDVTNKFINLLSNLAFRKVLFVCHVLIILIRLLLMVFFHYWLFEDPGFNFIFLILIYAPRFFYMLTMLKILFQPTTEDFFMERVCEGFNIFDGAIQNEMKRQIQYDKKLNFNELSAKNITKFYSDKTSRFFQTLSRSVKPIFHRLFLIISPIEINILTLMYLFRNLEESSRLVKKLMLISAWIYQSIEVLFLTPCVILMALNAEIRGKALSLNFTFDSCVFFILALELLAVFALVVYLVCTRNENVLKGPERVF